MHHDSFKGLIVMEKFKTFKDFYPYYIEEHSKPKTKLLHFIGTSISLFFLVQLVLDRS